MEEEVKVCVRINSVNLPFSIAKLVYYLEKVFDRNVKDRTFLRQSFEVTEEYNEAMHCIEYIVTATYVRSKEDG